MANVIRDNMVVSLAYTLKLANGEVVDYSEAGDPLEYLHGAGNIIPGLERELTGLQVGDTKDVEIAPEDGYGLYDPEDVEYIERAMLPADMALEVGMVLAISDEEGNEMEAVVTEVGPQKVKLDFNHPLAGKSLFFNVEVIDVREASEEEIAHGHPHSLDGELEDEFEFYYGDDEDDEDENDERDYRVLRNN